MVVFAVVVGESLNKCVYSLNSAFQSIDEATLKKLNYKFLQL